MMKMKVAASHKVPKANNEDDTFSKIESGAEMRLLTTWQGLSMPTMESETTCKLFAGIYAHKKSFSCYVDI